MKESSIPSQNSYDRGTPNEKISALLAIDQTALYLFELHCRKSTTVIVCGVIVASLMHNV